MKKKQYLLKLLLGAVIMLFAACSNDDESSENTPSNVPDAVTEAFKAQFPHATNVKWTEKRDYHVATFDLSSKSRAASAIENEAWYTPAGICGLSELELSSVELEKNYAAVYAAWKTTIYQKEGYLIDDIDLLQRSSAPDSKVIKMEIEKGELERDLYFTLAGLLVKDIASVDDDENLPCPQILTDYVNLHYKGALIVDFEQENKIYEVEILISQGGVSIEKELIFNDKYEFIGAEIDIDDDMLVQLIKKILTKEQMAEIVKTTGEEDPAEWEIEITENKAGEITISVEDTEGKSVKVITLDKELHPIK